MLAVNFKRTKIVATVGPASSSPEKILAMIQSGVNVVRLNLSHGTHAEHAAFIKAVRAASDRLEKPVAIIADLQGPKMRVGQLPHDGLALVRGQEIKFAHEAVYDESGIIPIQHDFSGNVSAGQMIFLRDGLIGAKVTKVSKGVVHAEVTVPGILLSNQGINLPDADFGGQILTKKDLDDIAFAVSEDTDYIALSFVQSANDIKQLKARLKRLGSDLLVIAKIETKAAAAGLESIVAASDAVMVARGDLAVEVSNEVVPVLQRQLIDLGRLYKKPVIVATQMLESMMKSPQPNRAEVSDVAGAVAYGADAVMLSGETAMGQYPVETVAMMKRIIRTTEQDIINGRLAHMATEHTKADAISAAAITLADQIGASVIVAGTTSGQTARNLSSFRPRQPIIILTNNRRVYQQMALVWGGKAHLAKIADLRGIADTAIELLRDASNIKRGDSVVIASGHQAGLVGGTDTIQVRIT